MRRIVLVLVVVMIASACGDDDTTRHSGNPFAATSTTTSTPPNTTSGGSGFPSSVRDAFLGGCAEEGNAEVCTCTLDEIQERITLEQFLALDDSDPIDRRFLASVAEVCAAAVGGGPLAVTTTTVPTTVTSEQTTTTTSAPVRPMTLDEVTDLTITDLEEFWRGALPDSYGVSYDPVDEVIQYRPSSRNVPACGGEPIPLDVATDNAFYCRPDDYIAWDAEGLFPDLFTDGDFTVALVLAHEWGHAIQNRVNESGPTIQTELQADCFAGAWTGAIERGERPALSLQPGDIEEAMAGYLLFRDPPGTTPGDPGAHGSAFDRVNAFRFGFLGDAGDCRSASNDFPVAFIPLTQQDLATGGDLPFAEAADLLGGALEAFWVIAFPELFDGEWAPVSATIPYLPSSGQLPACGSRDLPDDFYENNAFYCPDDDFIAWDNETLFPDLYQSIGDFAIGQILAHEWSTAAQARAGLPIDSREASLQADCLTGAFTAALVPFDNPTGIVLSAGDLDEGVAGFIQFGDSDPLGSSTAFDRFDAFQGGFFNGAVTCLGG